MFNDKEIFRLVSIGATEEIRKFFSFYLINSGNERKFVYIFGLSLQIACLRNNLSLVRYLSTLRPDLVKIILTGEYPCLEIVTLNGYLNLVRYFLSIQAVRLEEIVERINFRSLLLGGKLEMLKLLVTVEERNLLEELRDKRYLEIDFDQLNQVNPIHYWITRFIFPSSDQVLIRKTKKYFSQRLENIIVLYHSGLFTFKKKKQEQKELLSLFLAKADWGLIYSFTSVCLCFQ